MSYLALDLWDKRVGIAFSREWISFPLNIVERPKIIQELKKIIQERNIKTIIIGLPYDLYDTNKTQLEKTQKFIEKLKNIFSEIEIIGFDERFTTFEAENIQKELWIKGKYKDDISAFLILESYLDSKK
jgi:putative holliday junction resolvase